jgi:hypothetical protein
MILRAWVLQDRAKREAFETALLESAELMNVLPIRPPSDPMYLFSADAPAEMWQQAYDWWLIFQGNKCTP